MVFPYFPLPGGVGGRDDTLAGVEYFFDHFQLEDRVDVRYLSRIGLDVFYHQSEGGGIYREVPAFRAVHPVILRHGQ